MKFEEFKAEQKPKRNYYEILGVSPSATAAEIKNAFRKLAKETHPDLAGEEKRDEFLEVEQAYTILSDESKRAEYDRENSIRKESDNKENESGKIIIEDDDWEEFMQEVKKDKELMMLLVLSKNSPGMEEEIKKVLDISYKAFKMKKKNEKEIQELDKKREELNRRQEELNRKMSSQPRPNYGWEKGEK